MWIAALDKALQKLKSTGFDFKSVAAVSGTGQVRGKVISHIFRFTVPFECR